jgi:hypothetical protein
VIKHLKSSLDKIAILLHLNYKNLKYLKMLKKVKALARRLISMKMQINVKK